MSNPDKWKRRLLPRGIGKNPNVEDAKALNTMVHNVLKEVRKSFKTIVSLSIPFLIALLYYLL